MPSLVKLKQDMQFNAQLSGLLDALKSIAAQQFQILEKRFQTNTVFFEAIQTILGTFDVEQMSHPFTRPEGPVGVIVVTSDTGLLGGLNQQAVQTALREFHRSPGEMMVVGERGTTYVREAGLSCHAFPGNLESGRESLAAQVRDYALNRVLGGHLAALSIVHPRAYSFTVQRVELVRVLPCGELLRAAQTARGIRSGPLLMESPLYGILEYLVWLWLGEKLVEVLGMSRLAELAARSVHLEGSSQELRRWGKQLRARYFRTRREVIDRNMRELSAAKAIYAKSS